MKSGAIRRILLLAAGSVFLFSGAKVLSYQWDLRQGAKFAENMAQMVVVTPKDRPVDVQTDAGSAEIMQMEVKAASPAVLKTETDEEITEPVPALVQRVAEGGFADVESESADVEPEDEKAASEPRVAPIQVDFDALCAQNEDVIGWLYCPDSPINYPVVQGSDNDYYMHRLLDGRKNYAGSLFMDYRNSADFSDWNSVIYGHNMRNDSMFGTLTDYKDQTYFDEHSEIFLLTPEHDYAIKVLAGFVTANDSELYNALRPEDEKKDQWLKKWLKTLDPASDGYPTVQDHLITLSTCSYEYDNARYVLIGLLEELDR